MVCKRTDRADLAQRFAVCTVDHVLKDQQVKDVFRQGLFDFAFCFFQQFTVRLIQRRFVGVVRLETECEATRLADFKRFQVNRGSFLRQAALQDFFFRHHIIDFDGCVVLRHDEAIPYHMGRSERDFFRFVQNGIVFRKSAFVKVFRFSARRGVAGRDRQQQQDRAKDKGKCSQVFHFLILQ